MLTFCSVTYRRESDMFQPFDDSVIDQTTPALTRSPLINSLQQSSGQCQDAQSEKLTVRKFDDHLEVFITDDD